MMSFLALGMVIDALLGEPKWIWSRVTHPIVMIGKIISLADKLLNRASHRKLKGIFFLFLITYAIKENREIYFIFSLTFLTIVPGLVFKVTHGISFSFIGHYLIFAYLISDSIKIIWKKYLKFF